VHSLARCAVHKNCSELVSYKLLLVSEMNTYSDNAAHKQEKAGPTNRLFVVLMVLGCLGAGWYISRDQPSNHKQRPATVGVYIPSLSVATMAGVKETITFDPAERPTVIYVLYPDCRWCGYNMRNIKSLSLARGGEYRFIGISPPHPDLTRYAELNKLPFPIFQIDSLDAVPNLLLGQTPETIVIDKHGNVIADWNGAYAGDQQKLVEAFFDLRLPGLLK
jgi:hypothetical protein